MIKSVLILVIVVSICSGCSVFGEKERTKWRPVKHQKQVLIHVVRWEDETYEMIAKWYTGKKERTEQIINANPTLNPDKLQIDDKVYIPRKSLRTRKTFSRKYVAKFYKKSEKKSQKQSQPPVEKTTEVVDEDFQLFGPR